MPGKACTLAAATTPVPDREIGALVPVALTLSDGEKVPAAVGLKVIVTLQFAPAASELPQVVVREKCDGAAATLKPFAVALPVLVMVTDCGALEEPTFTLPKAADVGLAVGVAALRPAGTAYH